MMLSVAGVAVGVGCVGDTDAHLSFDERVVSRNGAGTGCSATPGSVPDGYPCHCDGDCAAGALCVTEDEAGSPGGACFHICEVGAGECTAGAGCVDIGAGPMRGLCEAECSSNADCPPANSCDGAHCQALCQADDECESGNCDPYLTLCTDGTPATGAETMESCLRDEDCKSGFCHPSVLRCVTNCSVERQGCPAGTVCDRIAPGSDVGVCFPTCQTVADCPDGGFTCMEAIALSEQICLPDPI